MNGTAILACVIAGIVSYSLGQTVSTIATDIAHGPKTILLTLEKLEYSDGEFRQKVIPTGAPVVKAAWTAQILRDDRPICEGHGVAPYDGTEKIMDADYWTGGVCPEILAGDVAVAAWQWTDEKGLVRTISARLIIQ